MRKFIPVILALATVTIMFPTACSSRETSTPSFDSRTIQLLQTTLDSALSEIGVPGATATVVRPDGATWVGVSGVSDVQKNVAMSPGLKFRIGSVTKTFTATVVLQLVKEGRLSLDQKLQAFLPGMAPAADRISIRQLLNHTSGLFDYAQSQNPDFLKGVSSAPFKKWKPESLIAIANANAPYFAPGEGYHYSNTNYVLLGMIIERVTGRTFAQEVSSRILVPLGLKNTSVPESTDMPAGSTNGYVFYENEWIDATTIDASWAFSAGNMISNSDDLLVWLNALMQGALLDKQLTAEMFTFVDVAPGVKYGLGLENQLDAIGHTGDFVFGGQAAIYQLNGWRYVILTNASPSKEFGGAFGSEYVFSRIVVTLGNNQRR